MHYLSKNLLSSFNPSVFDVNVVYDLPMCLAAMQAGRGERRPENAKGNGHFSRNPPSPCDAIPTLVKEVWVPWPEREGESKRGGDSARWDEALNLEGDN